MQKNILDIIVEQKKREVSRLPAGPIDAARLAAELRQQGVRRGFMAALRQPRRGEVALIAEVKKASPSAGLIRPGFDPVQIGREYEAAGATCLSVLTDERFFQGSLDYLRRLRAAVSLPLLRKDFIIDARQILEAIQWGADAILLIVSLLDDDHLREFLCLAQSAGLDVLVEVHDEEELRRARAAGASLIGVNNRNLKTFKVDLDTTKRLAQWLRQTAPESNALLVAESGIRCRADVVQLQACGVQAILVGESLMREPDLAAKIRELLDPV